MIRLIVVINSIEMAMMTPVGLNRPNSPSCKTLLNELWVSFNDDMDDQQETFQEIIGHFIELKKICSDGGIAETEIKKIMVIFLDLKSYEIAMSFDLHGKTMGEYFVIGDAERVFNVNLDTKSLPYYPTSQFIAVLVEVDSEIDRRDLSTFFEGHHIPKPLEGRLLDIIVKTAIDAVTYGIQVTEGSLIKSKMFFKSSLQATVQSFLPQILDDITGITKHQYSKCFSIEAFRTDSFVNSPFTPGSANICCEDGNLDLEDDEDGTCLLTEDINRFPSYQALDEERNMDIEINRMLEIPTQQVCTTSMYNSEANDESKYSDQWTDIINTYLKKKLDITVFGHSSRKPWLELIANIEKPEDSTYRCRWCHEMLTSTTPRVPIPKPTAQQTPEIVTSKGAMKSDIKRNNEHIRAHESWPSHVLIRNSFLNPPKRPRVGLVCNPLQTFSVQFLEKTATVLHWVYIETRQLFSFNSHSTIMEGLESTGTGLGNHHRSKHSAQNMMIFISETMHFLFLQNLVKEQKPFTLIADGSTDSSGNHIFLIYFQTLENGRPTVYLYRLIKTIGESARLIWQTVENAIDEDELICPGFKAFFKSKLVGLVTDGAANMREPLRHTEIPVGENFHKYLYMYLRRNIESVHCMSHRLQLSYKDIVNKPANPAKTGFVAELEGWNNRLANYYSTQSYKRRQNLNELAKNEEANIRQFTKIFQVRWLPSVQQAYETIRINYDIFMKDLKECQNRPTYLAPTKQEALHLSNYFEDRRVVLMYHFMLDMFEILGKLAKKLQYKIALLIDAVPWLEEAVHSLTKMKQRNNKNVKSLLMSSVCDDKGPCLTIHTFLNSNKVVWKGVELKKYNPVGPAKSIPILTAVKDDLVKEFIDNINNRFPKDFKIVYDKFNPRKLPTTEGATKDYGKVAIESLSYLYRWDLPVLKKEWETLLVTLISTNHLSQRKHEPAHLFWSTARKNNALAWTAKTQNLIDTILSIGNGGSNVEQGFSSVTLIKTKQRGRLSVRVLEHLMRIKINGPSRHKNFKKFIYAEKWILTGKLRSDDPSSVRGPKKSLKSKLFFESALF